MQIASLKILSVNLYTKCRLVNSGADPGFFLGGGAPQRNGVTDGFFFRIPVVLESHWSSQEGGGGVRTPCTLPLDPPLQLLFHQLLSKNPVCPTLSCISCQVKHRQLRLK